MRVVLQRVLEAQVLVAGEVVGRIGQGVVLFVALAPADSLTQAEWILDKVLRLRIFDGDAGFLSNSLEEIQGEILLVSQFTLYGDVRKGRRPSFSKAMPPQEARLLFAQVEALFQRRLPGKVACGCFGADMRVSLCNDGPLTLVFDSPEQ